MDNNLILSLHTHFAAKPNLTDEESKLLTELNVAMQYFPITYVHRDDLESQGYNASDVDDATMDQLADMMKDGYLMDCYWIGLDCAANTLGIKKLKDNEDA